MHFNPRSPCGERHKKAPLRFLRQRWISIHAPRAGSDRYRAKVTVGKDIFQSTLPVRGATNNTETPDNRGNYFNPRSPCGERPG